MRSDIEHRLKINPDNLRNELYLEYCEKKSLLWPPKQSSPVARISDFSKHERCISCKFWRKDDCAMKIVHSNPQKWKSCWAFEPKENNE